MNHAPEFIETMRKLAPLLREHQPLCLTKFEPLCDYVAYFWNRGTISFFLDEDGEAQGVCLVKLFARVEQFLDILVHEPCGRYCMIEVMVAHSPEVMSWIHEDLLRRWGPQKVVLWDRGERTVGGAPRMWTWEQFEKLAWRICNYGRKLTTA